MYNHLTRTQFLGTNIFVTYCYAIVTTIYNNGSLNNSVTYNGRFVYATYDLLLRNVRISKYRAIRNLAPSDFTLIFKRAKIKRAVRPEGHGRRSAGYHWSEQDERSTCT